MKPIHSVIVFLLLVCTTSLSSIHAFRTAEKDIVQDMNQALAQTLALKQDAWITPDTIQTYRSHLRLAALRDHSIIYYSLGVPAHGLRSQAMSWQGKKRKIAFQGYANCSAAAVWTMADHTAPFSLSLLTLLWAAFAMYHFRKQRQSATTIGCLRYDSGTKTFYDAEQQPVGFTPMQQQLMAMFCETDGHCLGKQEICDALWPKKPDANETLYTLIARLKPVIEQRGRLKIVSDRGRGYELREID